MTAGHDPALFLLALDHRQSLRDKLLGIDGTPTATQLEGIRDVKRLIFEGAEAAVRHGADPDSVGLLVDEEYGAYVLEPARAAGMKVAVPVEKSGRDELEFEHGDRFGEHLSAVDPDFAKVLVRLNPEGDRDANQRQLGRLVRLSDWLASHDRPLLFELLVPPEPAQLDAVDGSRDRYDRELRPGLMVEAIERIQDAGVQVAVWKIEGLENRADCERIAAQTRRGGRNDVVCVLLGRGADPDRVDHWLRQAAPVEGFVGFAIGRSIWWEPIRAYLEGAMERQQVADAIATNYLRFVAVFEEARV